MKKLRRKVFLRKSKSGMTIAELLVATALLGIATAGAVRGLEEITKSRNINLGLTERHNIMNAMVDNIRSNISKFQIHSEPIGVSVLNDNSTNTIINNYLAPDQLGFAWSTSRMGTIAECPECPGRYDYVVQPIELSRGLYLVTIRMTNPELFEGYRQYQFITTSK